MCRVLKAHNFPHSEFLHPQLGYNPSYTWTSIFASQDLIWAGSHWKVGVDSRVRVWGMPWFCDDAYFCIRTPCLEGLEEMRVHELVMNDSS